MKLMTVVLQLGRWSVSAGFVLMLSLPIVSYGPQGFAGEINEAERASDLGVLGFDLAEKYQPNYEQPRKYNRTQMELMASDVLVKIEEALGQAFDRKDPQHVWQLADFFLLLSRDDLDLYSTPMEEGDVYYFSEINEYRDKEFYPQTAEELIIRFYWEGLARIAAAHYQLEVVNEKRAVHPQKSRGKVSDMATTAMFDKKPRMSTADAREQGKERYDFGRLIHHLKLKGLQIKITQRDES